MSRLFEVQRHRILERGGILLLSDEDFDLSMCLDLLLRLRRIRRLKKVEYCHLWLQSLESLV